MVDHNVISAHRLNRSEVDEETAVPARLPLVDVDIDTNEAHSGTAPEDLLQGLSKRRSYMLRQAKEEQIKCDLPCFDEEDDGIPPFCRHERCPLDHRNKWLNIGSSEGGYADYCVMFGNVGFPFFDRRRGFYMGLATISTLMAVFITTYGCFSLAKDKNMVLWTYWMRASVFNSTVTKLKDENSFEVYVGLTSMVKKVCVPGTGCFDYELELVEWWKSTEMGQSEDGVELCEDALAHDVGVFCGNCRNVAVNNIPAAFFSCATLCFALYGCINRMKFISDCPVQKILGCITDTWGTISLASMLIEFNVNCVWTLPAHTQGYTLEYIRGPGFYMYTFCMLTALVRAVLHWLTPLPSQGVGCHMVIPSKDETVTALTALRKWEESARKRLQLQIVQGALVTKAVAATGAASGAAILRRSVDLASSELSHKCPRASAAASGGASAVMSTTRWSLNEVSARANALKRTSSGDGVADVTSEVPNPAAGWSAGELTNHLLQKIGKDNAITAKEAVDQLAISAPSNLQHLISATVSDIPEEEDVTMLSTWSPSSGLALAVLSQNMPRKKAGLNGVDLTPDFSETGDAQGDEESGKVVMTQPSSSSSSSSSSSNSCPSSPLYRTSEGVARFDGDVEAMNKAMIPEHPSGVSETKHDASPSRAAEAEANSSSSASHMKEYYETPSKEEST